MAENEGPTIQDLLEATKGKSAPRGGAGAEDGVKRIVNRPAKGGGSKIDPEAAMAMLEGMIQKQEGSPSMSEDALEQHLDEQQHVPEPVAAVEPQETNPTDDLQMEMLAEEEAFAEVSEHITALVSDYRREAIEKRCTPLDVEQLIVNGEVRQRVIVVPGKFEPTFRSNSTREDMFIKEVMFGVTGSAQYIRDKFALMQLTLGVVAINNQPLPSHLDGSGRPTKDLFWAKYEKTLDLPATLIADLAVNHTWFSQRAQGLTIFDEVKNG